MLIQCNRGDCLKPLNIVYGKPPGFKRTAFQRNALAAGRTDRKTPAAGINLQFPGGTDYRAERYLDFRIIGTSKHGYVLGDTRYDHGADLPGQPQDSKIRDIAVPITDPEVICRETSLGVAMALTS